MIGVILLTIVCLLLAWWWFSGKKDRSDIINTAHEELENAKAARTAAKIQAETKQVLSDTDKIHNKD